MLLHAQPEGGKAEAERVQEVSTMWDELAEDVASRLRNGWQERMAGELEEKWKKREKKKNKEPMQKKKQKGQKSGGVLKKNTMVAKTRFVPLGDEGKEVFDGWEVERVGLNTSSVSTTLPTPSPPSTVPSAIVSAFDTLRSSCSPPQYSQALAACIKVLGNMLARPSHTPFTRVRMSSSSFQRLVAVHAGGYSLMFALGFEEENLSEGQYLVMQGVDTEKTQVRRVECRQHTTGLGLFDLLPLSSCSHCM